MTYAKIILLLLQLVQSLLGYARDRKLIKAGEDAEIAKASAAILKETATAKKIMEEIGGLDEKQTDELLTRLERE